MLVLSGDGSIGVRQNPDAFKVDQTYNQVSTNNKNHYSCRMYGYSAPLWTQTQPAVDGPGGNNLSYAYRFKGWGGDAPNTVGQSPLRVNNSGQSALYVLESYNPGGYWNTQSGFYTAPESGLYLINYGCGSTEAASRYVTMYVAANSSGGGAQLVNPLTTYKNYKFVGYPFHWESDSSEFSVNYSGAAYFNKYDIIGLYTIYDGNSSYTRPFSPYFSITFIGG